MNDQGSDPTDREGVCDLVPSESDSHGASSQLYYIKNRVKSISRMSDRGSQYTSETYRTLLGQAGIQVNMSRKGNCYDNAAMESFFGSLKGEWTDRRVYATRREARQSIFEYMEVFYNRQRLHSSLGYVSPVSYEQRNE